MATISDTTSALNAVRKAERTKPAHQDTPEELRKACRQFEEIFVRMVLKEAHIDRSLSGDSDRSGLYGDMVVESLAKSVASGGGLGMADMLYHQLSPKLESAEKK